MDSKDIKAVDTPIGQDVKADVAPASGILPSGAPLQVTDVDLDHPAVDNNPRANTTERQNRIDFNDPTISGADAVARNLGMKTEAEANMEASKAPAPATVAPAPAIPVRPAAGAPAAKA